jgi:predicted aminopeptidase
MQHRHIGINVPLQSRRMLVRSPLLKLAKAISGVFAALALTACSTLGYYGHLAHGEYAMLAARQPIDRIIADPSADATLKARLRLAVQARAFASDRLRLPRNASYTQYADLHRPYATWNVFAAGEFSVDAFQHCFPIVGCLGYRGYFDLERARDEAARLRRQDLETWIAGSPAYSTLGWFADPILNTMLRWDDDELAGTIFHELAHQRLYVQGDTEFNESFATFVQREGLRQWRAWRDLPLADSADDVRSDEFARLVLAARERLRTLYASPLPAAAMREKKREEIDRLRADYATLRDTRWHGRGLYDDWIQGEINNAKLLPFGLYHRWVPAFAALFAQQQGDWSRFYSAADKIARLKPEARTKALTDLQMNESGGSPTR